ncbi:hypothetical protein HKD37_17G047931 [Glycine soja]|uniref:Uncharacterized protein n=1 Tax=Glycine soja TaxID=3848 RepID=A0A445G7Q3_GLYSO|nr:hypothetical protein D0Y65_046062 [Glycine soja]
MIVACSKNHVATTLTWGDNESGKFDLDLVLGVQHQASQPLFDTRKAFTGSIIEDAENIQNNCKRTKFNFITVSSLTCIYTNHEFDLHRILVLNLQNRSPDSKCREDNYKKMRRLDLFCIWRSNGVASMILACAD